MLSTKSKTQQKKVVKDIRIMHYLCDKQPALISSEETFH